MASDRLDYVFRTRRPDVVEREQPATLRMEAYDTQGRLAAPTGGGASTFTLFAPDGTKAIDAIDVVVVDEVATVSLTALQLPEELPYSTLYMQLWSLVINGTTHRPRRETAVAPFLLECPVSENDLTSGKHPDLPMVLGEHGQTLFPFLDDAWAVVLEGIWDEGQVPHRMVSTSAFRKPVRTRALASIFEFLFRKTSNQTRFETLWRSYDEKAEAAAKMLRSRIDETNNGLADSEDRWAAHRSVHRNGYGVAQLPRTGRY